MLQIFFFNDTATTEIYTEQIVGSVRCVQETDRQLSTIHRCSKPSRVDKARRLGYKAKQGFVVYRIRIKRGGRKRMFPRGAVCGKPSNQGINQVKRIRSLKSFAEERAGKMLQGLRVLNSYWVGQDGANKFYEVILVDPFHNAIKNDPRMNWICNPTQKHRELRGLTSTGKKYRGLRNKGHKASKARPSRRANWKRRNTLKLLRYR
eukprot:TRINITY_DN76_c0_g1_i4.p1 TRINITY_DN76_c0_g1~~TRINITY_DN76_c0_g1_i4.p1  ORF type:complete len:206 (+),score=99.10 TRINITY_DN76_c0_g1_i4:2-619(+)